MGMKVNNYILHTRDVEKDLDLLISGGSSDSSVPLGAHMGLYAGVLLQRGNLSCTCSEP